MFSEKLKDAILDICGDCEFQYDLSKKTPNPELVLEMTTLEFFELVINDSKLLKVTLTVLSEEYEHDIKLEEESGEDCEYLHILNRECKNIIDSL